MKKRILITSLFVLILFMISHQNNSYDFKIELNIKNQNPLNIEQAIAQNIENKILEIKEIKDIVIFSSLYGCNLYCKCKRFKNKKPIIDHIERSIKSLGYTNYKIDDKYYLNYHYFIILNPKQLLLVLIIILG